MLPTSFTLRVDCVAGALAVFKSKREQGCHDLGVCDKVVLNLDSSLFHNRSLCRLYEISLILKILRRHGLVADSKTVAPNSYVGNLSFRADPSA